MNKNEIESLGFIEDKTFELEDWIKPYCTNLNILDHCKFKFNENEENLMLYYNLNSSEENIILVNYENMFVFTIETIEELIKLLNQTGFSLYLNYYE